jgi:hypothetical protein
MASSAALFAAAVSTSICCMRARSASISFSTSALTDAAAAAGVAAAPVALPATAGCAAVDDGAGAAVVPRGRFD